MRRSGQVIVEMLLILPVFLGIVFTIMEIGYVSFQLIVLNHATFEAARVGAMTYFPSKSTLRAVSVMQQILPNATVSCTTDTGSNPTAMFDTQAGIQNMDLMCTGSENVQLIFPISSILLAKPAGSGKRALSATVYMPIEQPLPQ
jgi:Flp pilus assembly protein TadG